MRKYIALSLMLSLAMTGVKAQNKYDTGRPFGWAECTSLTSGDDYTVTGGGVYDMASVAAYTENDPQAAFIGKRVAVVRNTGGDMRRALMDAIKANDIIIIDGIDGDLVVSKSMSFRGLRDKTIIGRNNARISTQLKLTPEIHKLMNDRKVLSLSTESAATPFVLPNGMKVKEECEYAIRLALIEYLNDERETFRESGLFQLNESENIIIRNLTLVGPGAIDVSGDDLLTVSHGSRHIWVDHCTFVDGIDGNFDISGFSDFLTVSWCVFRYTERTFIHANTNLIGSSDNAKNNGIDNLNVTYAYNRWGEGCKQRMPMARFGTIHVVNNLYDCANNAAAVNPRRDSEVLVENNYFDKGVKHIFKEKGSKAYQLRGNIYKEKFVQPADKGVVSIPYTFQPMPADEVKDIVTKYAGARL